ncbi:alanine--tRNA ligase, mitochondrial isoform X2 [Silurus meridionalis]|uniref:alanine--tRNA ligase, mitochondrial isoform X2 n=1 Tax=Silurus meridionalis TaxID=175797 RepID=UPI001EEC36F1|nr:alanine--tRNA ligase, mitochondrial isoform X2 [Silurus meridionalis]
MAARIGVLRFNSVLVRTWWASVRRCSLSHTPEFTAKRVRRTFVDFFEQEYGHRVVPSSPVRPRGDPSLLFVNAGMNQFKPMLLGCADPRSEMATYRRVVNTQKCVRAGGKHNDLEDVGRDVYHHTFFEMLGNWSFGDYFKVEACTMAWRLLTEVYGIPVERLYVSYFAGDMASGLPADKETQQIWLSLGVHQDHILPFGMKDNFWEMGETGPCGPCTEIHYDHIGGRNAAPLVNADSPDVVEIWNLVFMQYNREGDGSLRPLPQCSVDTGMGLERLVTLLQGKRSNYDTDLFTPLLSEIHKVSKADAYAGRMGEDDKGRVDMAYRVVADHIRTLCVCIADGVYPGMSGAELVLRRILRRAVRFCTEVLQAPEGALASLVPTVAHILGDSYPELYAETGRIMEIVNANEAQFLSSLKQGRRVIERTLKKMEESAVEFPAAVAWSLHRNLGFPLDLIDLMLEERNMTVDKRGLGRLSAEHEKSQAEGGAEERGLLSDLQSLAELQRRGIPHTEDSPKYSYTLQHDGTYAFPPCRATVLVLYNDQGLVSEVTEGQRCSVLLDRTCFYAEQGGQMHDTGYFTKNGVQDVLFPVDSVRVAGGYVVHEVTAADALRTGDHLELYVDEAQRLACMAKHTATHVLNFALRELLGSEVVQRGSHVTADRLRFDFSSKASLSASQLQEVEQMIQTIIQQNDLVHTQEVPLAQASQIAGLRTVDEVYPDPVRVVSVGLRVSELLSGHPHKRTSVELCCGTHLLRTGGIEDLVIVSERQMVKGISRIIAVTGDGAKKAREAGQALLEDADSLAARITSGPAPSLPVALRLSKDVGLLTDAVENTPIPQWQRRELQMGLKALQRSTNTTVRKLEVKEAVAKAQEVLSRHSDKAVLVDTLDTDSISVVMKTVNQVSDRVPHTLVMLLSHLQPSGRVLCACQVPKGQTAISANEWALAVCKRLGGNAGGSAIVAQGVGIAADSRSLLETLRWAEEFAHKR